MCGSGLKDGHRSQDIFRAFYGRLINIQIAIIIQRTHPSDSTITIYTTELQYDTGAPKNWRGLVCVRTSHYRRASADANYSRIRKLVRTVVSICDVTADATVSIANHRQDAPDVPCRPGRRPEPDFSHSHPRAAAALNTDKKACTTTAIGESCIRIRFYKNSDTRKH